MSTTQSNSDSTDSDNQQYPDRQEAQAVLPASLQMAEEQYKLNEDNDNSANMTVVGDGRAVNRVIVVGTLMNVEDIGSDSSNVLRGEIFAGNNTVSVTAGQYSPQAQAFLQDHRDDCPVYVSLTAKINLNHTENTTYVNLDPEDMSVIGGDESGMPDAAEQWLADATNSTLEAVNETLNALESGDESQALRVWQNNHDRDDLSDILDEAETVRNERMG
jgi:RPA family protein